eukprot:gene6687-4785_t
MTEAFDTEVKRVNTRSLLLWISEGNNLKKRLDLMRRSTDHRRLPAEAVRCSPFAEFRTVPRNVSQHPLYQLAESNNNGIIILHILFLNYSSLIEKRGRELAKERVPMGFAGTLPIIPKNRTQTKPSFIYFFIYLLFPSAFQRRASFYFFEPKRDPLSAIPSHWCGWSWTEGTVSFIIIIIQLSIKFTPFVCAHYEKNDTRNSSCSSRLCALTSYIDGWTTPFLYCLPFSSFSALRGIHKEQLPKATLDKNLFFSSLLLASPPLSLFLFFSTLAEHLIRLVTGDWNPNRHLVPNVYTTHSTVLASHLSLLVQFSHKQAHDAIPRLSLQIKRKKKPSTPNIDNGESKKATNKAAVLRVLQLNSLRLVVCCDPSFAGTAFLCFTDAIFSISLFTLLIFLGVCFVLFCLGTLFMIAVGSHPSSLLAFALPFTFTPLANYFGMTEAGYTDADAPPAEAPQEVTSAAAGAEEGADEVSKEEPTPQDDGESGVWWSSLYGTISAYGRAAFFKGGCFFGSRFCMRDGQILLFGFFFLSSIYYFIIIIIIFFPLDHRKRTEIDRPIRFVVTPSDRLASLFPPREMTRSEPNVGVAGGRGPAAVRQTSCVEFKAKPSQVGASYGQLYFTILSICATTHRTLHAARWFICVCFLSGKNQRTALIYVYVSWFVIYIKRVMHTCVYIYLFIFCVRFIYCFNRTSADGPKTTHPSRALAKLCGLFTPLPARCGEHSLKGVRQGSGRKSAERNRRESSRGLEEEKRIASSGMLLHALLSDEREEKRSIHFVVQHCHSVPILPRSEKNK